MWFLVDDGELVFNTMRDSAKGRALAREPRVALCVDDPHPPFSFVQIQGVVTTTEDHHQLLDTATRIAARYMGPNRADEFGQRNAAPGGSWSGCGQLRSSRRSNCKSESADLRADL